MKTDLVTAIVAAILGFGVAFFATRLFIPELESISFKTLNTKVDSSLTEPDENIFNYEALNPTVEVYVGECQNFDENGDCLDDVVENESSEEETENTEDTTGEETEDETDTNTESDTDTESNSTDSGEETR